MPDASTIVAAFSEEQVERLTALTKKQLRYWDKTGFFIPCYADEDRRAPYSRIYSFKDVVALRTISVLRNQYSVPLQHLRKVAAKLRHLEDDLWVKTILYVLNKKVVFKEQTDGPMIEVVSGQYVIGIPLKTVISDTKRDVDVLRRRSSDSFGKIEQSRHINHNASVIAGTRIPTAAIRRYAEAGYSYKEIISEYPDLKPEDIKSALEYEKKNATAA